VSPPLPPLSPGIPSWHHVPDEQHTPDPCQTPHRPPPSLRYPGYPQRACVPTFVRGIAVYTCTRPAARLLCSHASAGATPSYARSRTPVLLTLPVSSAAFSSACWWYGCHSALSQVHPAELLMEAGALRGRARRLFAAAAQQCAHTAASPPGSRHAESCAEPRGTGQASQDMSLVAL